MFKQELVARCAAGRLSKLHRAEREARRFGDALSKAAFAGGNPSPEAAAALERVAARWERGYQAQRDQAWYIRTRLDCLASSGRFDGIPF